MFQWKLGEKRLFGANLWWIACTSKSVACGRRNWRFTNEIEQKWVVPVRNKGFTNGNHAEWAWVSNEKALSRSGLKKKSNLKAFGLQFFRAELWFPVRDRRKFGTNGTMASRTGKKRITRAADFELDWNSSSNYNFNFYYKLICNTN